MELLFSTFLIFVIYNIVAVDNAVTAALFLILLAVTFSMFLFYLNVSFLAILYLAVYIGAVAVFFLFVVMMTDLNSPESSEERIDLELFLASLFFGFLLSILVAFLVLNFDNNLTIDFFNSNIESIGLHMFNEHTGPFVLVALIILVTLIGSIFITFNNSITEASSNFNNDRSQDMEVQLSRGVLTSVNLL